MQLAASSELVGARENKLAARGPLLPWALGEPGANNATYYREKAEEMQPSEERFTNVLRVFNSPPPNAYGKRSQQGPIRFQER